MKYGVELVISAIIFVILLFVVGYIIRKKYYKDIDQLEAVKMEIMNQPVAAELAKVKQLNMTGKTEELFEKWRKTWDEIVTVRLPHIDELLFDAEEFTDKFHFNKVKEVRAKIETSLSEIDKDIQEILDQLKELVESEEKNRTDFDQLKETYNKTKKRLITEGHTYGSALNRLDSMLKEVGEKIANYEQLTEQGDYLGARKVILSVADELKLLEEKLQKVPILLKECQTSIPSKLEELTSGYREMIEQGYVLEHIQMDQMMESIKKEMETYKELLSNTETEEVEKGLEEAKEKIESLYDLLEKEVYARQYIMQKNEETEAFLLKLVEENAKLLSETDQVQESYQLMENHLDIPVNLEKSLSQLVKRNELLKEKLAEDRSAFSFLGEELAEIESELEQLEKEQKAFAEHLQRLRKDELEAREKIADLKRKISEIVRLVQKSRMPGLPSDVESLYEQAGEQVEDVFRCLREKPLNMEMVQKYLYEATDTVDHLYNRMEEHIENARFAEQVIQYANRYRGQDKELRESLETAERAFRNYEYRAALEQAATAVEKIEPGALKRIEQMFNEELHV
ncbi:septation ring formation regulator EzrA [Siminovitchia sp. FSL H7-0308]|uniref:Septation ring formation regulator EzrA n=1 Tax=Siminovitchia thermophila TaxID=1245522 RepID=A0ABS2R7V8_9BACI|nr:septation ring formation regulator EzrA [Siminovitchia thermophila]MBM7715224.1 septation ring formation regulator [Siminovitchia thermophila]ONK24045.1 septation ring formation regulator EzrA [Bacillus sp. VT-16-64]